MAAGSTDAEFPNGGGPIPTEVDPRILVERVRLLYARTTIGLAATGINALLVTLVCWGGAMRWRAPTWLFAQLAFAGLRYLLYLRFRASGVRDPRDARVWLRRFRLGALSSGVLWGSAIALLDTPAPLPQQTFLAFVLGGMVAGAAGLHALDLRAFAAYSVPSLTPVTVQLLAGGGTIHLAMGSMVGLFALLMSWIAVQNNRSIVASLLLRGENLDLVASLTSEKHRAEVLNRDLCEEIRDRERAEQELRDHRDHLEELVESRARGLAAANAQLLEVIAEREQAVHQTSRIAQEWTSTFDNMLDMVAIIGSDMRIARANAPLARFLSTHPRELIGKPCHEVLHGRAEPWPGCPHREALSSNAPITREVEDPRLGVPLLVTCSPFIDEGGRLIGAVHVARDISAQKKADSRREELIGQLQQAVANVKLLSGLLPICSGCKKIRDDQGYWTQLEKYIHEHSEAEFSHGLCPECAQHLYPEYFRPKK